MHPAVPGSAVHSLATRTGASGSSFVKKNNISHRSTTPCYEVPVYNTALILFALGLFAQRGTVTGKVTDTSTGEALAGATVIVDGAAGGAATDRNGMFTLGVDAGTAPCSSRTSATRPPPKR
ncbi:MAG: carboxypeptidase-like regulatory domain-containing protein [Lewinellaceae bacterium]|nr:carboxypeptidase-like regulatory domain-containing protein [Lewinellaceae bacterium]